MQSARVSVNVRRQSSHRLRNVASSSSSIYSQPIRPSALESQGRKKQKTNIADFRKPFALRFPAERDCTLEREEGSRWPRHRRRPGRTNPARCSARSGHATSRSVLQTPSGRVAPCAPQSAPAGHAPRACVAARQRARHRARAGRTQGGSRRAAAAPNTWRVVLLGGLAASWCVLCTDRVPKPACMARDPDVGFRLHLAASGAQPQNHEQRFKESADGKATEHQ